MNVAVLGASSDPDKYSYRAVTQLRAKGHTVFPVHPALKEIDGIRVYASLDEISAHLDTLTLYVNAAVSSKLAEFILAKKPRRIIFNPGAENPELESRAQAAGITTLTACTLVMLSTGQF